MKNEMTNQTPSVETKLQALVLGLENSRDALGFYTGEVQTEPDTTVMAEAFYHVKDAHELLADPEISVYVQAILERRVREPQADIGTVKLNQISAGTIQ